MELDELKQQWQAASAHDNEGSRDVQLLLKQRGQSSLAALKKSFRKQIVLLVFVFFMIFYQLRHKHLMTNLFFWWYLLFCVSLCVFFYVNFRIVKRLDKTDDPLSAHLLNQVTVLEKRMRWHRIFTRVAVVVLILFAEILPYFSTESMLVKWHAVNPFIRIAVYAGFILFQYYAGKRLAVKRYGQHLERLKTLLNDTK
jgi:hypothetical protein